jgi:hypothetical protein
MKWEHGNLDEPMEYAGDSLSGIVTVRSCTVSLTSNYQIRAQPRLLV